MRPIGIIRWRSARTPNAKLGVQRRYRNGIEKVCFAPIVLKNSKIAVLRKSRKCCALAISAAARLCRNDTRVSDRFAVIDTVPHLAARETHQRSREFSMISENRLFQHNPPEADSSIDWAPGIEEIRQSPDRQHIDGGHTIALKQKAGARGRDSDRSGV
jgi:hypothetical protein